ncbi:hypothetical protein EV641_12365 [Rhodococcus sp. SMB37]|uniref:hypothetical protein n=1 Tax=Rhodococcus sp. SMB37 TaxID=2512213 RepID=UPI0010445E08|nr:hypothetical protein [Rhodococcus sp. SMB37]TCN45511.1 hypothetical protein EV641_12365 [Rhodococcus sp. SMB37]
MAVVGRPSSRGRAGTAAPVPARRRPAGTPGLLARQSEQILRVIPAFHPVWEHTDPDILSFPDAHAGHGNFRSWAKLTAHTVRALQRLDRDQVDREVLGSVFAKMAGRSG